MSRSDQPTELARGTILQGRYRIVEILSEGGMGRVYKIEDIRFGENKIRALKQAFYTEEEQREWFENEARLLRRLKNDSLPEIHDVFYDSNGESNNYYFVMDFIDGPNLEEEIKAKGPFHPNQVLPLATRLLEVLDYLHTQEPPVIHRDIKPPNIKMRRKNTEDSQDKFVLLDFGIAKVGPKTYVPGSYTPHYSPLEQEKGDSTDARSDLYALGATLYYLLTGNAPPRASDRYKAIRYGQLDPLRPVHQLNLAVSEAFADLIRKAMALKAEDRFETASAMHAALSAPGIEVVSPAERGKKAAERDLQAGKYIIKSAGQPVNFLGGPSLYSRILGEEYQIDCVASDEDGEFIDAYNAESVAAIKMRFGPDILEKVYHQSEAADAHFHTGKQHYDNNNFDAAISDLSVAVQSYPSLIEAYYYRGLAYLIQYDGENARSDFERILAINRNNPRREWRQKAHRRLEELDGPADSEKKSPKYIYDFHIKYNDREEDDLAIKRLSRLIEDDRSSPEAHYHRGLAYQKIAEPEKAVKDFNAVLASAPATDDGNWHDAARRQLQEIGQPGPPEPRPNDPPEANQPVPSWIWVLTFLVIIIAVVLFIISGKL